VKGDQYEIVGPHANLLHLGGVSLAMLWVQLPAQRKQSNLQGQECMSLVTHGPGVLETGPVLLRLCLLIYITCSIDSHVLSMIQDVSIFA
jgi:hypothetical protein